MFCDVKKKSHCFGLFIYIHAISGHRKKYEYKMIFLNFYFFFLWSQKYNDMEKKSQNFFFGGGGGLRRIYMRSVKLQRLKSQTQRYILYKS